MADPFDLVWAAVMHGNSPLSAESETAVVGAYEALLAFYLQRDGEVTPHLAECPAADRLVERGAAHWKTCLTLGQGPQVEAAHG